MNRILGYKIKQLADINAILERQGNEEKNHPIKMKVTLKTGPAQVLLDLWLEVHQVS